MKKLKYILLILLVVITCGCSNRKEISSEDFLEYSKGYNITNIKSSYDFTDEAYLVTGDNNFRVMYFRCDNLDTIKAIYEDETRNIINEASLELQAEGGEDYEFNMDDISSTLAKSDTFTISTYKLDNTFYRLSRVENTLIIGSIDIDHITELNNFMTKIHY